MASRATVATVATVAIFDVLAFRPERKICLLGRSPLPLRSVLDVRHRRTAPPNPASGQLGPKCQRRFAPYISLRL